MHMERIFEKKRKSDWWQKPLTLAMIKTGEGGIRRASHMAKVKSCIEDHSTTAGHVSNLPQPWVNETKETPQEAGN